MQSRCQAATDSKSSGLLRRTVCLDMVMDALVILEYRKG